MPRSATDQEIKSIAKKAVDILAARGFSSALFGSAACKLFGASRTPNDVDLVVLTTHDREDLKRMLARDDPNFYIVNARDRSATYKVLWYRIGDGVSCKVDILVPGILNIPDIPPAQTETLSGLPVLPIVAVLLLKLQGWAANGEGSGPGVRRKKHVDVRDVDALLAIACQRKERAEREKHSWLTEDFLEAARRRVTAYLRLYPGKFQQWANLGIRVA